MSDHSGTSQISVRIGDQDNVRRYSGVSGHALRIDQQDRGARGRENVEIQDLTPKAVIHREG